MKINKLIDLKRTFGLMLKNQSRSNSKGLSTEFPKEIIFSRGIEFPQYKITIEEIEDDYFIDAKGTKWMKVKE